MPTRVHIRDVAFLLEKDPRFVDPEDQDLIGSLLVAEVRETGESMPKALRTLAQDEEMGDIVIAAKVKRGRSNLGWLVWFGDEDGDQELFCVDRKGESEGGFSADAESLELLPKPAPRAPLDELPKILKGIERDGYSIYDFRDLRSELGDEAVVEALWRVESAERLPVEVFPELIESVPSAEAAAGFLSRWSANVGPRQRQRYIDRWDEDLEAFILSTPQAHRLPELLDGHVGSFFVEDTRFIFARRASHAGVPVAPPALEHYAEEFLRVHRDRDLIRFEGAENIPGWPDAVRAAWLKLPYHQPRLHMHPVIEPALEGAPTLLLVHRLGAELCKETAERLAQHVAGRQDLSDALVALMDRLEAHCEATADMVGDVKDRSWCIREPHFKAVHWLPDECVRPVAEANRARWERLANLLDERHAGDKGRWSSLLAGKP